jgi:hypothetical protein
MLVFNISEAYNILGSLGILLLEMVIYSIFIFKFYRFLSSRDIIKVDYSRYSNVGLRFIRWIGYLLQNIFLFPVIVFFWFAILAMLLGFLGKHQTTESILLVSIALVSAIRIAAYYSEDLSRDLAKMLPFALLGIYLVDQSYFEFEVSLELLKSVPEYWRLLVYYFAFIIALEFILRILHNIVSLLRRKQEHPPVMNEPRKP